LFIIALVGLEPNPEPEEPVAPKEIIEEAMREWLKERERLLDP